MNSHRGGELVQGLVEVVHLRQDAESRDYHKHIGRRMRELVISAQRKFHRDTEGLDRHDGHRADGGADRDVDEGVSFAVCGRNSVDHNGREDGHCETVDQESYRSRMSASSITEHPFHHGLQTLTGLERISQDFVNGGDLLVGRRVENDDHRSEQAHGAAEFAQCAEGFLQKV